VDSENIKDRKNEQSAKVSPDVTFDIDSCVCKVLVIDTDSHFRDVISNSLRYFSFNGNELEIIEAASLDEAERLILSMSEIILIIFNKMTFGINGNSNFLDLLGHFINKKNGKVIFRYNGASPKPFVDMTSSPYKTEGKSEFEHSRDRLIDLAQMAIITYNNDNLQTKSETGNVNRNEPIVPEAGNELMNATAKPDVRNEGFFSFLEGDRLYDMLAHGLKGPIGNIKVLMDAITSDPDLFDEETSHKLLSNVRSTADSMNEMIDSYLFWSRVRKNELDFNPIRINVKNLILENITLLKGTAAQKDIELKFSILDDAIAFADEVMMITVLRNLIYNAIKFTSGGGQVIVKARNKDELVEVSVQDTGIGISDDNIDRLFNPEAQVITKGTENEIGSGLGLLLCRDYVEKNGGKISAESAVGIGSIFVFTIPRWKNISQN